MEYFSAKDRSHRAIWRGRHFTWPTVWCCVVLGLQGGAQLLSCRALTPAERYTRAVQDAREPAPGKVCTSLVPVCAENTRLQRRIIDGAEHILVVSWKAQNFYPDSGMYNTDKHQIWVTTSPELRQRMSGVRPRHRVLRLKQLLGLPPEGDYKYFVELWVRPGDLFRPCPDGEIADTRCAISLPATDSAAAMHLNWVSSFRQIAFPADGTSRAYPWTQLGYTYDWSPRNKSHRGCSEFVIRTNSNVYVHRISTTDGYFSLDR